MSLNIDCLLIVILFAPCIYSEHYHNYKFPVSAHKKSEIHPDNENLKSLEEINYRIDGFESRMTQVHLTLEKLLKLHGLNQGDFPSDGQFDQRKSKVHTSCDNIDTHIDNEVEKIKNDLKIEIDKKHVEQIRLSAANLEMVKQDITKNVAAELRQLGEAMYTLKKKLDVTNKWLEHETNKFNKNEKKHDNQHKHHETPKAVVPPAVKVWKNCKDALEQGNVRNGVYVIKPPGVPGAFEAFCDMQTKGGGWLYFMRRFNGSQNFDLNWKNYKEGFGKLDGEFWLGLEHLYELTGSEPNELLFELTDWEGKTVYSHFKTFSIGNESERYAIKAIKGYSGDGGNSFIAHKNWKFSTLDKQDAYGHCVKKHNGPWWYGPGCFHVKLTGKYLKGKIPSYADGIHYVDFHDYKYSLKEVKMMIRP